jgi:hypothetical protein
VSGCGLGEGGFFEEGTAVGHGVVLVGLACEGGGTATTTAADVEESKPKGEEED